ncbi:RNA export factor gle2 [Mycoemilia scoparia]|uniref:RNA export factor gle2 n=1 Tax=Mycoemilia scoparia TaxID=417184 RepID=A0A9W7ZY14_9FUNG|nr:RNA export factor gle2 [Mycoemilia scoparia]
MSAFGGFGIKSNTQLGVNKDNNDMLIHDMPDTISELAFSPDKRFLAGSCWDGNVYVWEFDANFQSRQYAMVKHDKPALCCTWSPDGSLLFSGGADNLIRQLNVATQATAIVGKHDQPIQEIRVVTNNGALLLASASWDKTLKFWNLQSEMPVHTVNLPERPYAMDALDNLIVVGLSDCSFHYIDATNPNNVVKKDGPGTHQTTTIAMFPDKTGYAVCTVEGRTSINYFTQSKENGHDNFTYRCHRTNNQTHPVNVIRFNPQTGTFATAGADGMICFWDKVARSKTGSLEKLGSPVTAMAYSPDGRKFAYALGYDWGKGVAFADPQMKNQLFLHTLSNDEYFPKGQK